MRCVYMWVHTCTDTRVHTQVHIHAHMCMHTQPGVKGTAVNRTDTAPTALTVPTFRELAFWNIGSSLNNSSYN